MEKRQIVFIHGWGMNRGIWNKLIQQLTLSDSDDIITLDLPGYADTPALAEETDIDAIAKHLVSQLKPDSSVILVGWSLGGLIATSMAKLISDRLQSLILIASTPKFTQNKTWPHAVKSEVFQNFYQQLKTDFVKIIQRFIAITVMGSPTARKDQKEILTALSEVSDSKTYGLNLSTLEAGLDILLATDFREELINFKSPLFILTGDRDTIVPVAAMESIRTQRETLNLHCELEVIHHAGHAPFISHTNASAKFLQKILS